MKERHQHHLVKLPLSSLCLCDLLLDPVLFQTTLFGVLVFI